MAKSPDRFFDIVTEVRQRVAARNADHASKRALDILCRQGFMNATVLTTGDEVMDILADLRSAGLFSSVMVIADEHRVHLHQILGRSRCTGYVAARHDTWLMLSERGYEYAPIGRMFRRDHSSIMHGCTQARKRRADAAAAAEKADAE